MLKSRKVSVTLRLEDSREKALKSRENRAGYGDCIRIKPLTVPKIQFQTAKLTLA